MFGLLDSIAKLTVDVVDITLKPVEMCVDATRIITKPAADVVKSVAEDVKNAID